MTVSPPAAQARPMRTGNPKAHRFEVGACDVTDQLEATRRALHHEPTSGRAVPPATRTATLSEAAGVAPMQAPGTSALARWRA